MHWKWQTQLQRVRHCRRENSQLVDPYDFLLPRCDILMTLAIKRIQYIICLHYLTLHKSWNAKLTIWSVDTAVFLRASSTKPLTSGKQLCACVKARRRHFKHLYILRSSHTTGCFQSHVLTRQIGSFQSHSHLVSNPVFTETEKPSNPKFFSKPKNCKPGFSVLNFDLQMSNHATILTQTACNVHDSMFLFVYIIAELLTVTD